MTNEAYIFNSTNRERAITKRSAAYRKCGAKSKKCSLEVDKMSQKQIEKQHGPVESWNLTKFYSWEEFKKMPVDLQAEYINRLIDTYHVGIRYISLHLFGKGASTLDNHTRRFGYEKKIHACQRGVNKEAHQAFLSAIEDSRREAFAEEEGEYVIYEEPYDDMGMEITDSWKSIWTKSENKVDDISCPEDPIFRHDVSLCQQQRPRGTGYQ